MLIHYEVLCIEWYFQPVFTALEGSECSNTLKIADVYGISALTHLTSQENS